MSSSFDNSKAEGERQKTKGKKVNSPFAFCPCLKETIVSKLIVLNQLVWDSSREKRAIKIGKLEDNDIVLQDPRASRNHAVIIKETGRLFYLRYREHKRNISE